MAAIRGAICAENTVDDISEKSLAMMNTILEKNGLAPNDVCAALFSATKDLNACYPARSVRENLAMTKTAFMCFAEMDVKNGLDHCIRVCVLTDKLKQADCVHCYIGKASVLREDLQ